MRFTMKDAKELEREEEKRHGALICTWNNHNYKVQSVATMCQSQVEAYQGLQSAIQKFSRGYRESKGRGL